MAARDQHNFRPRFKQDTVPCEGEVGDILVLTPLADDEEDREPQGSASVWFCIRAESREGSAVWARIQFDGVATCERPVPIPPQTRPVLTRG